MKKVIFLLALFSTNVFATPVNINKDNAQTIADSLNGIGIKKAEAIVAYREKNGDFKTVESLTAVSGVGEKTVEKNKADILLENPSPAEKQDVKKETKK